MSRQILTGLALVGIISGQTSAATSSFVIDPTNTIPGVIARGIIADGQGLDWTSAVLRIELTQGSVHNAPTFDSNLPQSGLWGLVPELEWDTWFGVPGDGTNSISGGAGDLGGGPLKVGPDAISITWVNTTPTDTGPTRIANISLSADAVGTWDMLVGFAGDQAVRSSGFIIPEPGTLALLGVCGLGLVRRSRIGA